MNFGKRGVSFSVGPRGSSLTFGTSGAHANLGIPGTGLAWRSKIGGKSRKRSSPSRQSAASGGTLHMDIGLDGKLIALDEQNVQLSDKYVKAVRQQMPDDVEDFLESHVEAANRLLQEMIKFHEGTPFPSDSLTFEAAKFTSPRPQKPMLKSAGILGLLMASRREKVQMENQEAQKKYRQQIAHWEEEKSHFEHSENRRRWAIETGRFSHEEGMELAMREALSRIEWPRETHADFELRDGGKSVILDVDLPTIEEMPQEEAAIAGRLSGIRYKKISDTQIRKNYMLFVHGIAFRIIGEVFRALPNCESLTLSGYTQIRDGATGHIIDEYLFSVKVPRPDWMNLNFRDLSHVNPVESLANFELRRKMTKTGIFRPIEPFE